MDEGGNPVARAIYLLFIENHIKKGDAPSEINRLMAEYYAEQAFRLAATYYSEELSR